MSREGAVGSLRTCPARVLKLAVAISGGAIICIEIVGAQLVTPFFGSSIYVWGSVICVFLGALSLGYSIGGRLTLRRSDCVMPAILFFAAGALVLLASFVVTPVCNKLLDTKIPLMLMPVIPLGTIVMLFFLPALILGTILPLIIQTTAEFQAPEKAGRAVGVLYALNAAGSMAGALATTFILAAFFGNHAMLRGCGFLLIFTSIFLTISNRSVLRTEVKRDENTSGGDKAPWDLRAFIFICGVVVMGLEVVGGAQIAPYFGSTVFVWGSLIVNFLCAMTAGYRIGGILADRPASKGLLSFAVIGSGCYLLLVPFIAPTFCNYVQSFSSGGPLDLFLPLFVVFVFYFVPVTCFAIVAPVAVRLGVDHPEMMGNAAGGFYALSTMGNVIGLLLTTFVLIPLSGATKILTLSGVVAVLSGLVFQHHNNPIKANSRSMALPASLICIAVTLAFIPKPDPVPLVSQHERFVGTIGGWSVVQYKEHPDYAVLRRTLYETESPYQHVAVIDEKEFPVGKPVILDNGLPFRAVFTTAYGNRRGLRFDRYTQSSVMLDDHADAIRWPFQSGLRYTDIVHIPILMNPQTRDVLVIGGGGGVLSSVLKADYPVVIDVVELDPVVVSVASKWFGLTSDERLSVYGEDGRTFVRRSRKRYDYIFLDAYTTGGRIPFHLTTGEFMEDVKAHLSKKGVVLMNIISAIEGPRSKPFRSILKTIRSVFGESSVFVFPVFLNGNEHYTDTVNILVGAVGPGYGPKPVKADVIRCLNGLESPVRDVAKNALDHVEHMLSDEALAMIKQEDVPVLTDDYAPVDLLTVTF